MRCLLFFSLFMVSGQASARVFNISQETVAAYFNVTGGGSSVGVSTMDDEALAGVKYSGNSNYTYTGEFGFLAAFRYFNLKAGVEFFKPLALDASSAKNGSTELYNVDSSLFGYAFKGALDINLYQIGDGRSYVSVGVGMVNMDLKNTYDLTAAGQAQFAGLADHEVKAKGKAMMYSLAAGYEGYFADTTTFVFEFGYRYLPMNEWNYNGSGTTFSGAYSSGDSVEDINGSARKIDLSGGYISLGFRVYL